MIIAIGCDHSAYDYKLEIIKHLKELNYHVIDVGCDSNESTHYPVYGFAVGKLISEKNANFGIVLCGTGIGIANAAEKIKNVRCSICNNLETVKFARENYDANVISCGARVNSLENIVLMIDMFIKTEYNKKNITYISALNNLGFSVNVKNVQKIYDKYNMEQNDSLQLPKILLSNTANNINKQLDDFIKNADNNIDQINLKFGNCNCCKSDKKFEK